jgi:hypothetical protein
LAVSLAFFSIYVVWVYSVGDTKIDGPKVFSGATQQTGSSPSEGPGRNSLPSGPVQRNATATNGLGPPPPVVNRVQSPGAPTAAPAGAAK